MRVSEAFGLGRTQAALDFVDVDTSGDVAVFVDPRALLLFNTEWGQGCVNLVQEFFSEVLRLIGEDRDPRRLLGELHEPNETRLGLSRGRAQGRAIGEDLALQLGQALQRSQAVATGLLQDLEDTVLLIPGIGPDMISDITTNLIRGPLLEYTQEVAEEYGMALERAYPGPVWSPATRRWTAEYADVLRADGRPLILVPKAIVRRRLNYDADEYYEHYILPQLQSEEIEAATELVELLRNGRRRVTKRAVREKYGQGKSVSEQVTLRVPRLLEDYRRNKADVSGPMSHDALADVEEVANPNWDDLLAAVTAIPAGTDDADRYHSAVKDLTTALFYPALTKPVKEQPIHDGRKRIDISFANVAKSGFFYWLALHHPAGHVFIECKNYTGDPGNPELDQLAGRFSPSRGQVGLLICRTLDQKERFIQRCRDTATDRRGFIIALDDSDLEVLVEARKRGDSLGELGYLKTRFDELIM